MSGEIAMKNGEDKEHEFSSSSVPLQISAPSPITTAGDQVFSTDLQNPSQSVLLGDSINISDVKNSSREGVEENGSNPSAAGLSTSQLPNFNAQLQNTKTALLRLHQSTLSILKQKHTSIPPAAFVTLVEKQQKSLARLSKAIKYTGHVKFGKVEETVDNEESSDAVEAVAAVPEGDGVLTTSGGSVAILVETTASAPTPATSDVLVDTSMEVEQSEPINNTADTVFAVSSPITAPTSAKNNISNNNNNSSTSSSNEVVVTIPHFSINSVVHATFHRLPPNNNKTNSNAIGSHGGAKSNSVYSSIREDSLQMKGFQVRCFDGYVCMVYFVFMCFKCEPFV